MAITLEVKVYEVDEIAPPEGRLEITGIDRTLLTDNINQAIQLVRLDINRVLAGPPEKDE